MFDKRLVLAAVIAVLLVPLRPAVAMGVPTLPQAIADNINIRTAVDDVFEGFWSHLNDRTTSPVEKLVALNRDYEAGRARIRAAYEAQRLIVWSNSALLPVAAREWCLNKLNESYNARLAELAQRHEAAKAKLAGCMF